MDTLTSRQVDIIKQLTKKTILTSENLANLLHVSSRTIRNDIRQINQVFPNSIRTLQSSGYTLDDHSLLQKIQNTYGFEESGDKTDYQVLKKILSVAEYNIDELSDELFISSTSLLRIVQKINQKLDHINLDVHIIRRNNNLIFIGTEEEKRKAVSHYLVHEFSSNILNINDYQSFFNRAMNLKKLEKETISFFQSHEIKIKDIEFISFMLHVTIMVERIRNEHNIVYENNLQIDEYYYNLGEQYYEVLKKVIDVTLNDYEKMYLATLFAGKIHLNAVDDSRNFSMLIDLILKDINEIYGYDFQKDERLKNSLLSHMVNLQNRVKYNSYLINPMLEDIKRKFPILYDVSVYMADQIQNYFKVRLYEDEISYLTLHLMGSLERTGKTNKKSVIIVSPVGNSGLQYFKKRLRQIHHYEIQLEAVLSAFEIDKIEEIKHDIILCFDENISIKNHLVYYVKNLLNDEDIENIYDLLNASDTTYSCLKFFDSALFFSKVNFENKEQVIDFLCSKLYEKGYVEENYKTLVLEREKVAPTAYGNTLALPHPIKKEGLVNKIAVCILQNAILWNDKKVRIVLLMCLSKSTQNSNEFDELFHYISIFLDDTEKVKKVLKSENLQDFLNIFISK